MIEVESGLAAAFRLLLEFAEEASPETWEAGRQAAEAERQQAVREWFNAPDFQSWFDDWGLVGVAALEAELGHLKKGRADFTGVGFSLP